MTELVALDVGGTNARFALASIAADGAISLAEAVTLKTNDFATAQEAWREFERQAPKPVPRAAAIAIAGPVLGDRVPMTNGRWVLEIEAFRRDLGLEAVTVLNDFGAVAHAAARLPEEALAHVAGPDGPLPATGTVSVIGPGTGLGVAHFHRYPDGYRVQATEGGHVGYAPQDAFEDGLLAELRERYGRVATERINAGPGIVPIYAALGGNAQSADREIWRQGLAGEDPLAVAAIERFCASLGSTVGDYVLAHGASAAVLAGGLGLKLRDVLPGSAFAERFRAKPRYETMMANIPVKLIIHPQPGLFGAAAAFASEHSI